MKGVRKNDFSRKILNANTSCSIIVLFLIHDFCPTKSNAKWFHSVRSPTRNGEFNTQKLNRFKTQMITIEVQSNQGKAAFTVLLKPICFLRLFKFKSESCEGPGTPPL